MPPVIVRDPTLPPTNPDLPAAALAVSKPNLEDLPPLPEPSPAPAPAYWSPGAHIREAPLSN